MSHFMIRRKHRRHHSSSSSLELPIEGTPNILMDTTNNMNKNTNNNHNINTDNNGIMETATAATTTTTTKQGKKETTDDVVTHLLWCCVARGEDNVILAEAGDDPFNGHVIATASQLLKKKHTPGYEFHSHNFVLKNKKKRSSSSTTKKATAKASFFNNNKKIMKKNDENNDYNANNKDSNNDHHQVENNNKNNYYNNSSKNIKLRGIKLHVYERDYDELQDNSNNDGGDDGQQQQEHQQQADEFPFEEVTSTTTASSTASSTATATATTTATTTDNKKKGCCKNYNAGLIVWTFATVYDEEHCTRLEAQSFLEKMIGITEIFRETPEWKHGTTLSCQSMFAPILLQRMQDVKHYGKMAMIQETIERSKQIMHDNITLLLERDEQLTEMEETSKELSDMALQHFKKQTKHLRRIQMLQHGKYGFLLGTIVVTTAAIVIVPPLVAVL